MADDLTPPDLTPPETDLYDRDYLAWTEQQARALRARRTGDNRLDYDNLAEEIEDLGKSEQRACESLLENTIEHLLKIEFAGSPETLAHWRKEIRGFRRQLNRRLTGTLENRLKPALSAMIADVADDLAETGIEIDRERVQSTYDWGHLLDADWYPESDVEVTP